MKIFSLNCRGLGNPKIVSELHRIVRKEDPSIVFLMETRLESQNLEFLRVRLGNAGPNRPILVPTNSGKKTTWKKKARSNCIISSEDSKSEFSMEPMLTPGKRALQVETEHNLQDQDEPCLKKSRTNGGMKSHEFESVEAVEQPRRAQ